MGRKSSIDRLPDEVKELIGALRRRGRTIDEILDKLRELDVEVSRSALGRHVQGLDEIASAIQWSRGISEALIDRLGDAPESKTARLNMELLQASIMRLQQPNPGDGPVLVEAREAMFLATALEKLSKGAKQDVEMQARLRREFASEKVEQLDAALAEAAAAGEPGLSAERVAQLRRDFLGVRAGQGAGEPT